MYKVINEYIADQWIYCGSMNILRSFVVVLNKKEYLYDIKDL